MSTIDQRLATMRVLFRAPDTLALYGIPYTLRKGQAPRDLWCSRVNGRDPGPWPYWQFLGQPGWWGTLLQPEIEAIEAWLALRRDEIPQEPYEWCVLQDAKERR